MEVQLMLPDIISHPASGIDGFDAFHLLGSHVIDWPDSRWLR